MTTSTDAILFYGYCWSQEAEWPWEIGRAAPPQADDLDEENWMERYARAKGLTADDAGVRALARASGCMVSTHCAREHPMPFVAVTASLIRSRRGYKSQVKGLTVDPAWDGRLAEFCKVMGIKTGRLRAAWWLVSDWS